MSVEGVRYRPGEAIRWLSTGAQGMRQVANAQGRSVVRREGERTIGKDVMQAAGALADFGKSAFAELLHKQAEATEYILHEDEFEIVSSSRVQTIPYEEVLAIRTKGDKATLIFERGSHSIKPEAYIVSGKIRMPIGWSRNDIEVPFEMLIDELAARSGLKVELI
jgi:hypothetical protein